MDYAETVLDLIGHTPLVRLNKVTEGVEATVLAKIEYLNPGGSSKDRIAVRIIEAAEREGKLKPGGTIVEPTSGNTGIGLALVAQQRGYRCVFVCPDKVSEDKRNTLIAYGDRACADFDKGEHSDAVVNDLSAGALPGSAAYNSFAMVAAAAGKELCPQHAAEFSGDPTGLAP